MKFLQIQLFFTLFFSLLLGATEERYIDNQEVILHKVKGLIITGDEHLPPDYILKTTEDVLFYRVKAPHDLLFQTQFSRRLGEKVLGKSLTFKDIQECKKEIKSYFLEHCSRQVKVSISEKEFFEGVVVVRVLESKVGKVKVTGNVWFPKGHYLEYIPLEENAPLDTDLLVSGIQDINKSPWKKAQVIYSEGKGVEETDIELIVKDKNPIHFYAGTDNSGYKMTEYGRVYSGFSWGNMLNLDQAIAFSYKGSRDFSSYQSFSLEYLSPLFSFCRFKVVGEGIFTQPEIEELLYAENKGMLWHLSSRVDLFPPQSFSMDQTLSMGLNYKGTNSNYSENELGFSHTFVTMVQMALEYKGHFDHKAHKMEGFLTLLAQPWQIGRGMEKSAYNALREGANPLFGVIKGGGSYSYNEKAKDLFSGKVSFYGQIATAALIPMEQYPLGGIEGVRGYENCSAHVDHACLIHIDIRSPQTSLLKYVRQKFESLDRCSGAFFLDVGNGWTEGSNEMDRSSIYLIGLGPGLRYELLDYVNGRIDIGIQTTKAPLEGTFDSKVRCNFSINAAY